MDVREIASVRRMALLWARQFTEQAFGDSRVESAASCLEDIASLLAREIERTPWQPMQTARDDGRDLLVADVATGRINRAFWLDGQLVMVGGHWTPTHWSPMPEGPKAGR